MDLREIGWGVYNWSSWLRIGAGSRLLWIRWWTCGFWGHGVSYMNRADVRYSLWKDTGQDQRQFRLQSFRLPWECCEEHLRKTIYSVLKCGRQVSPHTETNTSTESNLITPCEGNMSTVQHRGKTDDCGNNPNELTSSWLITSQ
jgi:hypothetical protein